MPFAGAKGIDVMKAKKKIFVQLKAWLKQEGGKETKFLVSTNDD